MDYFESEDEATTHASPSQPNWEKELASALSGIVGFVEDIVDPKDRLRSAFQDAKRTLQRWEARH